jgi:hypothetical protein
MPRPECERDSFGVDAARCCAVADDQKRTPAVGLSDPPTDDAGISLNDDSRKSGVIAGMRALDPTLLAADALKPPLLLLGAAVVGPAKPLSASVAGGGTRATTSAGELLLEEECRRLGLRCSGVPVAAPIRAGSLGPYCHTSVSSSSSSSESAMSPAASAAASSSPTSGAAAALALTAAEASAARPSSSAACSEPSSGERSGGGWLRVLWCP